MRGRVPKPITVFRGHNDSVQSLSCHCNNIILSGSVDGEIRFWNIETKSKLLINPLQAHNSSILSILTNNINTNFISFGRGDYIRIWDYNKLDSCVNQFLIGSRHFCNASMCKNDPNIIATPSLIETQIILWDIRISKPIACLDQSTIDPHGMVTAIQLQSNEINSNGYHLYLGNEDGSISLYDTRYLNKCCYYEKRHNDPVMAIAINSSDNQMKISTVSGDNNINQTIIQRDNDSNNIITKINEHQLSIPSPGSTSSVYRGDGKILTTGHWDKTIRLYDTKKLKPLAILNHHRDNVMCLCYGDINSDYKDLFISGSKDRTIAVWDLYNNNNT
mmetsp:Transcript_15512/g.14045  ORF Transcript_15512/g.14045 Transcript_15512/m.14045 type:complete len:333 (+) Transcript_15512:103-1101(+)